MLPRLSAVLLAGSAVAITITCPFVRRNRKGVLFIHYVLLHSIHVWKSFIYDSPVGSGLTSVLVGSAVLSILAEHSFTLGLPDREITNFGIVKVCSGLAIMDSVSCFLSSYAPDIGRAVLSSGILMFASYLLLNPRKHTSDMSFEELINLGDGTFFYDLKRPLNCLGRLGWMPFLITNSRLLLGLVPYISNVHLHGFFVVAECVNSWLIFITPVMIGGLIQTAKVVARSVIEYQMKRRILKAEKEQESNSQKISREELIATVEEEFSDEAGYATELI